jgi:hypothetical protein
MSYTKGDGRNVINQPPVSPNLGGLLELGNTPKPPTGSIPHLFISSLYSKKV